MSPQRRPKHAKSAATSATRRLSPVAAFDKGSVKESLNKLTACYTFSKEKP
jgi:hypothetical protein